MKEESLKKRVEELENRLKALESRPPVFVPVPHYVPYYVPYYVPIPSYPPQITWPQVTWCSSCDNQISLGDQFDGLLLQE
jgi:hypothetical protein